MLKPRIKEKRWSVEWEKRLIETWEKEGIYKPSLDPSDPRELIVIDTPPPYASGRWHVAGAAHYAQIDMVARYFRLKGYNVVIPFYADRNGLPVEVQVEKTYGVNAHEMAKTIEGRVKFLELCREFLDKAEEEIVSIWRRMGCSFDYWRDGTDSPRYREITQRTFIELYKKGMIYESERPVRWCPRCKTTLAEAEIEYKEEEDYIYYVKYRLADTGEELVVATTRPELLAGCAALAYHPDDERYKGLAGREAIAPIYGHRVRIVEHPSVDPEYGTGLMMICSFGDENDVKLFNELGLEPKKLISPEGTMLEEAGPIAGLSVRDARKKIAELLEKEGLLARKISILHTVPVCWRCKTPLQIIFRREYFLEQLKYRDEVKRVAGEMSFKPEMHRKKLYDWIDSLTMDWPISRDRFYATEIPLWTCRKCGSKLVPEPGRYYRPWRDPPPWDKCPRCGAPREYLEGEKRVFDTWFDSSISVLYVTRWMRDNKFYEKAFRNTLRPQGQDIIRTWLYYSILRVYQLTGKPAFRWVRITGMGLDPHGRPMHKSLGNIVDPEPVIEEYGADAFRFWSAISAKLGYDYRFDIGKITTGRNFVTKLWNLARFISAFPQPSEGYRLTTLDKAFLALYYNYIEEADKHYSELDVFEPINLLYEYTWDYYASNYVELVKDRAYNREGAYPEEVQRGAWYTLHAIFRGLIIALSPIMPFITDEIHRRLYGSTVHTQRYPEADPSIGDRGRLASIARTIVTLNKAIWERKQRIGVKLVEPLNGYKLYIPRELEDSAGDIEALHKVKVEVHDGRVTRGEEIAPGVYLAKAD
ncbi:MAG: valine--tRNA ligase [Desulfurococcales archaeon]|nr:valine--tRNA ligase [Desulfurococcales archaeon]